MDSHFELLIPQLRLWVPLGCMKEEKVFPQPVDIDINIQFSGEPTGCRTDQLADVCCYKEISEKVIAATKDKSFNLIEYLAAHIFDVVKEVVGTKGIALEIAVTKPNHPVAHVHKGIVFRYRRSLP